MKRTKIIAAVLCASMLAGFAGCSNGSVDNSVASETQTESTATEMETTEAETEAPSAVDSGVDYLEGFTKFELTSTDLVNGVWADSISNTERGTNASPELKWKAVDGAAEYVIYMVDMNTNGFIHWKSIGITDTEIPSGWAPSSDFIGPWPAPGDTHIYDVYVIALKEPVERLKGGLNGSNPKFVEFIQGLDTDSEGNTGNIIAYGKLSGSFTA